MNKEALSQYVERVMRQKKLSLRDIEAACDKQLTNSYIGRIAKGKISNLTLESLVILAQGLDVDPYEVFAAWYGKPRKTDAGVDPLFILDLMQQLVINPQAIELLQTWLQLSVKDKAGVLAMAEYLKRQATKTKGKKGRPRRK
jgi:transcriptional regulator with XRE-family HTH domain